MSKGIIFNIEEFAVHDGPGIRKLVFFKGCPLHCMWCHNPEGISFKPEFMVNHATYIDDGNYKKKCGTEIEAKELAKDLLKGKDVLINSGGGITISGGEPLAQPFFLFELIQELKPVNIAIETSGYAKNEVFQRMVSEVNLVFMDVKHTDPEIHKKYTGIDNSQILENLHFLCQANTDFYIRIPLIPGVTDTKNNMKNTAQLLRGSKHLKRVELLPYHQTAGAKYPMIGRSYNPTFDVHKKVNVHKEIFDDYNINVVVL